MEKINSYASLYRDELLNRVIPFWMEKSPDREYGGYFTCLERDGSVFDTDKFMWLQGREVWFFAMIYNEIEQRQEWLDMALLGAGFMRKYGMDSEGNWYFSLTREGKPLVEPYNIFSDCFATMAFGELYKATGNPADKELALATLENIKRRKNNPKGKYSKIVPETRPIKSFSLPMIMSNLLMVLEGVVERSEVDRMLREVVDEIISDFYKEELGLILESVAPDGSPVDSFEGRLINPGHTNEATWFIMDIAERFSDKALAEKCVKILLGSIEYGWDDKYDGIFYFMDIKNAPPQQLEWDQKLWWVHIETLIALAKGYRLTGNGECAKWFRRIHNYTWDHFRDPEFAEWYGYLDRRGEPLLTLKGGKWKGCFHVPRGLYQVWKTLEKL